MPDLRSELMKLNDLKFDDDVETAAPITQSPNFSKNMWEAIKANPNSTSNQIANLMNNGSLAGISTRLKQMLDRGLLSRATGNDGMFYYRVVGDSYPALSRTELVAKAIAAKQEKKAKREKQKAYYAKYKAEKQAQLSTAKAPAIPSTSLTSNPNAEQLVNSMSIGLAKAVYQELKKVFEG